MIGGGCSQWEITRGYDYLYNSIELFKEKNTGIFIGINMNPLVMTNSLPWYRWPIYSGFTYGQW